jgi:hypothetical protein
MTDDHAACWAIELARVYMQELEDEIESAAAANGIDTEGVAHLWKHVVEQALLRLVRLSPELVEHVGPRP